MKIPYKTSLEDPTHLPLMSFHLVVIVEPDQENWLPDPKDIDRWETSWGMHMEMIDEEFNPDAGYEIDADIDIQNDTKILWLSWMFQGQGYYGEFLTDFLSYSFRMNEEDNPTEGIELFISSLKNRHPDWKVAVIGGMYEQEVDCVARKFTDLGFDTTVLLRYCLSKNGFLDLDAIAEANQKWRKEQLKVTENKSETNNDLRSTKPPAGFVPHSHFVLNYRKGFQQGYGAALSDLQYLLSHSFTSDQYIETAINYIQKDLYRWRSHEDFDNETPAPSLLKKYFKFLLD